MTHLLLLFLAGSSDGLLVTPADFERVRQIAAREKWAAQIRDSIVQTAAAWPASHLARYGLAAWDVPPEGGQWTHWYVCPTHGVALAFSPPGRHICPIDKERIVDVKLDRVIYTRRNSDNAAAARDLALAYRFTGNEAYARQAAHILKSYAAVYPGWRIHDTQDRTGTKSGARAMSQTLDEAVWLIPIAWAYDLLSGSPAWEEGDRDRVEQHLLREAAATINRHQVINNWQSWHNAALGAVGFLLKDQALIDQVLNGPYGFHAQMARCVFADGVWNEGAWSYHFYALEPLWTLAEMAARNGYDLYPVPAFRRMFEAPLLFALPDWTLPAFNDSGTANAVNAAHELAWARYGDKLFGAVLGWRTRGREALFWGSEAIPPPSAPPRDSALFADSGYAALRAPGSDFAVLLKFGPHGGGHGHYDKLNFVSYARGALMAVDPGTQPYGAPTHATWDKTTVAHNTVVVDGKIQAEATGELKAFANEAGMSAVRAAAGAAYPDVSLERTLYLTADYLVDAYDATALDGAGHTFDWVYHNYGALSTSLPLKPLASLGSVNGYQHLTRTASATTAGEWEAVFATGREGGNYGSTYTNQSSIAAAFTFSPEQSVSGRFSGRMSYDFSHAAAGSAYIVYSPPALATQPAEEPAAFQAAVWGDGAGHVLTLRLLDSTGEVFTRRAGAIDWQGWRMLDVTLGDVASLGHWSGNADGVIDLPVRSVALQLDRAAAAETQAGVMYFDDFTLVYPRAGAVRGIDLENLSRGMRLSMAAVEGSTVVTGEGLGPDLRVNVPFVMVRRQGASTRFLALFEPFGTDPAGLRLRALDDGSFEVTGPNFRDVFRLDDRLSYTRTQLPSLGIAIDR